MKIIQTKSQNNNSNKKSNKKSNNNSNNSNNSRTMDNVKTIVKNYKKVLEDFRVSGRKIKKLPKVSGGNLRTLVRAVFGFRSRFGRIRNVVDFKSWKSELNDKIHEFSSRFGKTSSN